jgi:hypothetical protein
MHWTLMIIFLFSIIMLYLKWLDQGESEDDLKQMLAIIEKVKCSLKKTPFFKIH